MASQWIFLLSLAVSLGALFTWAFGQLHAERWQFIAAIPRRPLSPGHWEGLNLTWYGFFFAGSMVFATAICFVLLGAAGMDLWGCVGVMTLICGACLPAARLIAQTIEKKKASFTVGGASFVGIVLAPWVIALANSTFSVHHPVPIAAGMAALATAYAFGEGLGRLACISFGCCYGRPLSSLPESLQKWAAPFCIAYTGKTKKASFASGLEGQKVLPIQATTACIYSLCGLACVGLYLHGRFAAAMLMAMLITQAWRVISEWMRADYRGGKKFSAYQRMSVVALVYIAGVAWLTRSAAGSAYPVDVMQGLKILWHPACILLLQGLGVGVFIFTGRSQVTASQIQFALAPEHQC